MVIAETLEALGYQDSPNFLSRERGDLDGVTDYAHIFRKAASEKGCGLQGVYALRHPSAAARRTIVPIVYVCEADSEQEADRIHRRVWNQNVVPFLIVQTRHNVRFYSGFRYQPRKQSDAAKGILEKAIEFNQVSRVLEALRAEAIDDGCVWRMLGKEVTPQTRVDWQLLDNLKKLDRWLRGKGLGRDASHSLIGKFVYLRYLRDRDILSDRKLEKWGLRAESVFSRNATLDVFGDLVAKLDDWLNGAIFPIAGSNAADIKLPHLQRVAGAFAGDDPETGQLHLDFQAYDFSYIPIETLSVIYEQFLHTPDDGEESSRGEEQGAYYTPIPLVNLMLDELDEREALREGMKVLDPSCGSGAFLVQCYRRLIERHHRARTQRNRASSRLGPVDLRTLLEGHIFGVDREGDACRVAELSLTLALLDYVQPPDLENKPQFKLPVLRGTNIFQADFFDPDSAWSRFAAKTQFDWVVGNPPWRSINAEDLPPEDEHACQWMRHHQHDCPVGNNQLAEAFAWKVMDHAAPDGLVALLMPAMTLFNDSSRPMRGSFFAKARVWCVANLANLRHVLFGGRAAGPAAALLYQPRPGASGEQEERPAPALPRDEQIAAYTPFLANQEAARPCVGARGTRGHGETWSLVVNASEVRGLEASEVADGDMRPWKLAMWGSHRDGRLMDKARSRFLSLEDFAGAHALSMRQGVPLRPGPPEDQENKPAEKKDEVEFEPELVGKRRIDFAELRDCRRIFAFPANALKPIPRGLCHLRKRSGRAGLSVFRPPHIVMDSAGRFAVYSDEFLAVPPKPIGIAGGHDQARLLKALSLYLSSDFTTYCQFMMSPEWGVRSPRGTLRSLRNLPVPLDRLGSRGLDHWAQLHHDIVQAATQTARGDDALNGLIAKMNAEVSDVLELAQSERDAVDDLLHVRMATIDGKTGAEAVGHPSDKEVRAYLGVLTSELDAFVEAEENLRHAVAAIHDDLGAIISVELRSDTNKRVRPSVRKATGRLTRELDEVRGHLREQHSQWVYFERNLRIYEGTKTYLFKPMQRMHWTKTQAYLDADEIIADTLSQAEA